MAYVSKTWVDRDSQYPTRRVLVHSDLSEEQVTVRRDEGIITTQGDVFDANTMNNLEARIAAGIGEKQDTLTAGSGITIDENNIISATGGGGSSTLAGLDDTNISSPQNGQALIYDATSSKWVNANGGSGSATLAGLTDVTLTNPTADQVLKYDGTKWVNGEDASGEVELSKTVSGSVCSFSDGADRLPVKDLVAQVVAVQSGTGDPSPSNVRAISGFTGANVYRNGANVWDEEWELGDISADTGLPTTSNNLIRTKNFIPIKPDTQYYAYVTGTGTSTFRTRFYDADFNYIGSTQKNGNPVGYNSVFTSPVNAYYMKFTPQVAYGTTYNNDISINYPSTDTAYHAYTGTTVTIALGQTVFGGSLDVTSGVLTITHAKITLDGTQSIRTTNWNPKTNTVGWLYHYSVTNNLLGTPRTSVPDLKCDSLTPTMYNSLSQFDIEGIGMYDTNYCGLVVRMADTSLTTESAINTYLASNPIDVVFPLATPVTVQLTPIEVTTLLGGNNIWCDTGDTEVEYYTSTATDVIDLVQYDTTKQDKLTAGTGISIQNNVISATGGGAQALNDLTDVSVASPTDGKVLTFRSILNQWVASTPPVPWVELTATIPSRQPSDPSGTTVHVLISDSSITTTKTFDIYVDTDGVYPLSKSVSQGVIDLEFEAQLTAVGLKVRVS